MFTSITQYDAKYKDVPNYNKSRNACGVFALIVADFFLKGGDINKETYEKIIDEAVNIMTKQKVEGLISFAELLSVQKVYKEKDLSVSTADLLATEPTMFEHLIPKGKRYASVMLKNSKFFTVCVDTEKNSYSVYDCHMIDQYTLDSWEKLKDHLRKYYDMDEILVVDGLPIHEFSTVEAVVMEEKPGLVFDYNLPVKETAKEIEVPSNRQKKIPRENFVTHRATTSSSEMFNF